MSSWNENYIAGLLRERTAARTAGNKEAEAAVNRELAAYGYKAGEETASVEVSEEQVQEARTAPPKGRSARATQQQAAA